jgi:hypothetical protein
MPSARRSLKKPATKAGKKPNPWIPLERAAARIQQMLDPHSKVTHNETLIDRLGNKRQFDVVVRGTFAGHAVLGVLECKDHGRKMNPDAVEGFAKKCENLGADLKLMVSRLGFTKQALKVAKHENIRCLSLLPGDYDQTGLNLKVTCYAQIWSWADITLSLVPDRPDIAGISANDVLLGGKTVLELFDNDLEQNFPTYTTLGPVRRIVEFGSPLTLTLKSNASSRPPLASKPLGSAPSSARRFSISGTASTTGRTPSGPSRIAAVCLQRLGRRTSQDGTTFRAQSHTTKVSLSCLRLMCLCRQECQSVLTRSMKCGQSENLPLAPNLWDRRSGRHHCVHRRSV